MFGVVVAIMLFLGTVCLKGSEDNGRLQEKNDGTKVQETLEHSLKDPIFNEFSVHGTAQLQEEQSVKLSHSGDAQHQKLTYVLSLKGRGKIKSEAGALSEGSPLRQRWVQIKEATEDLRKSLNEFMLNATGNRLYRSGSERISTSEMSNEDAGSDRHGEEGLDIGVQKRTSRKPSRNIVLSSPALKKSSLEDVGAAWPPSQSRAKVHSEREMAGAISREKSDSSESSSSRALPQFSSAYASAAVSASRHAREKTKKKQRTIGFQVRADQKDAEVQMENADAECAVCKEQMHFGEKSFSQLPCGHFYHDGCWVPWIGNAALNGNNQTCPTCRDSIQYLPPRMSSLINTYKTEEVLRREAQRYENAWHAWGEIVRNGRAVVSSLMTRENERNQEEENERLEFELREAAELKQNILSLWQQARQAWRAIIGQIGERRQQEWVRRELAHNDLMAELEGTIRVGRDLERNIPALRQTSADDLIQQWFSFEDRWKQVLQRLDGVIRSALERAADLTRRLSENGQVQEVQGQQRVLPVSNQMLRAPEWQQEPALAQQHGGAQGQQRNAVEDFDHGLRRDWQEVVNVWTPNQLQDRTEWTGVEREAYSLYQAALNMYRNWNDRVRVLGQVEAARHYNEAQTAWSNFVRRAYNRGMTLRMDRARNAIQQDMQRERERANDQGAQSAIVQAPAPIREAIPSLGAVARRREIRQTGIPGVTEVIDTEEEIRTITIRENYQEYDENNNGENG